MQHFLVVFDRSESEVLDIRTFDRSTDALHARFEAERCYRDAASIEVVVLTAQDDDALRRTHGRYFGSLADLARRGTTSLGRQRDLALGFA